MRPPTIVCGEFRIRYRQVPYDDRYFFVDIKRFGRWHKEVIKIQGWLAKIKLEFSQIFGFLQSKVNFGFYHGTGISFETNERLEKFLDKVFQYDNFLDGQDK